MCSGALLPQQALVVTATIKDIGDLDRAVLDHICDDRPLLEGNRAQSGQQIISRPSAGRNIAYAQTSLHQSGGKTLRCLRVRADLINPTVHILNIGDGGFPEGDLNGLHRHALSPFPREGPAGAS